ncbi:MAG: hypothetical protein L3J10_05085 [Sulfurimonas sp.]|nr:hypothetical protein [Sulfurimonas sp.]
MQKNRIIKVVTSEIEIITRHYTYEVVVDENISDEFIEKMDGLCGYREMYEELNKHNSKLISKTDGKQYPSDDNFSSYVDEVKVLNQLAWSL